ncbi:MAG TPA: hypothetical protein VHO25_10495 [Polyangiaceae bacterium]|nr:hypothetical protein [Polyangiaceae bacterium]
MATIIYMAKDDRVDCIKWWCLREIDKMLVDMPKSRVAEALGFPQRGYVSQALKGQGMGDRTMARIADHKDITAGQAWDLAIKWWREEGGREWAIKRAKQIAGKLPPDPAPVDKKPERLRRVK